MCGNVWEWTRSVYEAEPYPQDQTVWITREDLMAGTKKGRVLRGGSWNYDDDCLSCAFRGRDVPGNGGDSFGFRVVASPFASR